MTYLEQTKQFVTDKALLLISLVSLLLGVFTELLLILQIDATRSVAAVRYNAAALPSPVTPGNTRSLYVFLVAPIVFLAIHILLAIRLHSTSRLMSLMVMGLLLVVLVFGVAISSAIISINR